MVEWYSVLKKCCHISWFQCELLDRMMSHEKNGFRILNNTSMDKTILKSCSGQSGQFFYGACAKHTYYLGVRLQFLTFAQCNVNFCNGHERIALCQLCRPVNTNSTKRARIRHFLEVMFALAPDFKFWCVGV